MKTQTTTETTTGNAGEEWKTGGEDTPPTHKKTPLPNDRPADHECGMDLDLGHLIPKRAEPPRGLRMEPGTFTWEWDEAAERARPAAKLACDFPKDFGTEEERAFLIMLFKREFDAHRTFLRGGGEPDGFDVKETIWSLLTGCDTGDERARVMAILNAHREPDCAVVTLRRSEYFALVHPGRGGAVQGAKVERLHLLYGHGKLASRDYLTREIAVPLTPDFTFTVRIYK